MADTPRCDPPRASSDAKVILVVNEDPLVRRRVARILTEAGYTVMTAGDAAEASVLARRLDDQLRLVVVGSV